MTKFLTKFIDELKDSRYVDVRAVYFTGKKNDKTYIVDTCGEIYLGNWVVSNVNTNSATIYSKNYPLLLKIKHDDQEIELCKLFLIGEKNSIFLSDSEHLGNNNCRDLIRWIGETIRKLLFNWFTDEDIQISFNNFLTKKTITIQKQCRVCGKIHTYEISLKEFDDILYYCKKGDKLTKEEKDNLCQKWPTTPEVNWNKLIIYHHCRCRDDRCPEPLVRKNPCLD